MKNAHLRRSPHPSSLQRTFKYASLLSISGALHLGIFDQPQEMSVSTGSQTVDRRPQALNARNGPGTSQGKSEDREREESLVFEVRVSGFQLVDGFYCLIFSQVVR